VPLGWYCIPSSLSGFQNYVHMCTFMMGGLRIPICVGGVKYYVEVGVL
jgi:hypothetical protein